MSKLYGRRREFHPCEARLGTTNFLSMTGVLIASGLLWIFCDLLGLPQSGVLLWLGVLIPVLTGLLVLARPEYYRCAIRWCRSTLPKLLFPT